MWKTTNPCPIFCLELVGKKLHPFRQTCFLPQLEWTVLVIVKDFRGHHQKRAKWQVKRRKKVKEKKRKGTIKREQSACWSRSIDPDPDPGSDRGKKIVELACFH